MSSEVTSVLILFVNGKKIVDPNPDPECSLLTYLREKLRLCGTKLGCGEGGCGACTVMVSKMNRKRNEIEHYAINACLAPICSMHGRAVTTIEGIGSTRTKLHSVQERIAKAHGSQCGFCTPGIVMSMYTLLRNSPIPSIKDLETAFQGNLCRCTGYRPILEGYKTFTNEFNCCMEENCCKFNGYQRLNDLTENKNKLFQHKEFIPYDPTQEPIFPPELKLSDELDSQYLLFKGPKVRWYRPKNLCELIDLKNKFPYAKIVVGNTEISIEIKFKNSYYPILISTSEIEELNQIKEIENGFFIGSSVSLTNLETFLNQQIQNGPEEENRSYKCIVDMLTNFAGKQIRNVASIVGNLMTGSPISDLNPILIVAGAKLLVASRKSQDKISFNSSFYTGYKENIIKPEEIIIGFEVPKSKQNQFILAFKQSRRRDDDMAIVTAAFNVVFCESTNKIKCLDMAFGGMAPTIIQAPETSRLAQDLIWDEKLLQLIIGSISKETQLSTNAPGGMVSYRRSLVLSLFFKAFLIISSKLNKVTDSKIKISELDKSAIEPFYSKVPSSAQIYQQTNKSKFDSIGKPIVHTSAFKQASGEAIYCDDIPKMENELHLALVLSTKTYAKILSVDATDALSIPGVYAFFSSKDIPKEINFIGPVPGEEEIFASSVVNCEGQILGAIVATTKALAQEASRVVKVIYEDLTPIIVTIEDAISKKSFFPGFPKTFINGSIEEGFRISTHIIEGECRMGGQEHFYLETNATVAYPRDSDEIELFSSTQMPKDTQKVIARVLKLPQSKVNVRVKRIGGAFGGKEFRSMLVSIPVAIAAFKLKQPVRCMLDRNEDMQVSGTRHPFLFKYKVGCSAEGKILACELQMYSNGGCTTDLSFGVIDRSVMTITNSYFIPNIKITSFVCKTNLPSNTAFRGFGSPQAMFACEHMIRDIAVYCRTDYTKIVELNMYKNGDITHYNQIIEKCNVRRCWDECIEQSNYYEQIRICELFNKKNYWRKRGIAICPTTYGIAFSIVHANQAGALINIYEDGSVLLAHGGVEMGQGLHTKMIQVASKALDIPIDKIHTTETATEKIPNTTATAASLGSDLNGMAVLDACNKINSRLSSIKMKYPQESWEFLISKAYLERISLSATGFYKTPEIEYDPFKNSGKAFLYYTFGAAASIVEIDCLTGNHQVLRTDIVMDIGQSLNPAIDIGQIEGGFMQGYGLFMLEEMLYSPEGTILSKGPSNYKIPSFTNIPLEFNVSLLKGVSNPKAIFSSKAVGEPPLFLASSVFFAIKHAITSARVERNLISEFKLLSPATSERIRMACEDNFTEMVEGQNKDSQSGTKWNVMP